MSGYVTYSGEVVDYGYHRGVYKRSAPIKIMAMGDGADPAILVGTWRDDVSALSVLSQDHPNAEVVRISGSYVYAQRMATHTIHVGDFFPSQDWKSWGALEGHKGSMLLMWNQESGSQEIHLGPLYGSPYEYLYGSGRPTLGIHSSQPSDSRHRSLYITHESGGLVSFGREGWYDHHRPEQDAIRFDNEVEFTVRDYETHLTGEGKFKFWHDAHNKMLMIALTDSHGNYFSGKIPLS